jgi:glutathione S-transferase
VSADIPAPPPLTLYCSPGACSRVTMVGLEEAGLAYTTRVVGLMQGENRQPEYLALNPKGKVPLLITPEGALSENVAILSWLDALVPAAQLLPPPSQSFARARALSWLAWSASALHPQMYRMRRPGRIHPDESTHEAVRAAAHGEFAQQLVAAEEALADGRPWLLGEPWSVGDAHLAWVTDRAMSTGLVLDPQSRVLALMQRQLQRPAWQRAVAREKA